MKGKHFTIRQGGFSGIVNAVEVNSAGSKKNGRIIRVGVYDNLKDEQVWAAMKRALGRLV